MRIQEKVEESFVGILEKELIDELLASAKQMEFKKDDILIDFGQYVRFMPILVDGAIRVMREDIDSGSLLLYFLERGETCAMTMTCCLGNKKSEIRAEAETDGLVLLVPVSKMEEWMGKYHSWREFVLNSYNNRFNELLETVDNVAFKHLDERLMDYLEGVSKISGARTINKTHQEIANELNSSRVVISRLLKALENQGKIKLGRNSLQLLD